MIGAMAEQCEVCGGPAVIVLQRRAHHPGLPGYVTTTTRDPAAKRHPRCRQHLGDAWQMDGVEMPKPKRGR